jgi:hypothetical protein
MDIELSLQLPHIPTEITVRGWLLISCCRLNFISGVRRNRIEFDYCDLFGSANAMVKFNPLSNI